MEVIRGGHTFSCQGASGFINETTEDRKVKDSVIKYVKLGFGDMVDITPDDTYNSQTAELSFGVAKANFMKANSFRSIHFNAFKNVDGAMGCEIHLYSDNSKLKDEAIRILRKLEELGFKNRGIKISPQLYELKFTECAAMIIEVCFVDSKADTDLYKSLGSDKVGKAIAEGILNKTITEPTENVSLYRVQVGAYSKKENAVEMVKRLKEQGFESIIKEE